MLLKVCHRLAIDLHHLQRTGLFYQILGHHSHTGTYLKYGEIGKGLIDGIGYSLGDTQVSQEVLAEILLRSYLLHLGDKGTNKREENQIKH